LKKNNYLILLLLIILLLAGCSKNRDTSVEPIDKDNGTPTVEENNTPPEEGSDTDTEDEITSEETEKTIPMRDFFLPEGSSADYKGIGNEFAQLKVETAQPFEKYYVIHENNGGSFIRKTYKIEDDRIDILEEKPEAYEGNFPSLAEIEAMKPIGIYLQKPFSIGTEFDGWTITETNATVETPFRTFKNAIVIEKEGIDFINRMYFVQGFGEVKREFVMTTEDDDMVVASELESIDGDSQ